ncbi:hypothetical protein H632_c98p3 [Helicosporidium sp. ATCC 50920]|nr:hypothetical protein H632_c98p3 [Helicosporidium sp. ATCC 50920]|eukprot:KDD76809.1 hypothetical protein H632_c98p3 [Helicosporidium sp. ATCC 50920]
MWAQKSAEAGVPCIRYTAKGTQLTGRVKTITAVLECARASPLFANTRRWIFGGHSMGGRVACEAASQLASSDPGALGGVLLFSYPLHPPANPTALRDEPPLALSTPLLIVKGSRDPFSTPEPWNTFVDKLPKNSAEIVTLQGGDHSLKTAKAAGGKGGESRPLGVATTIEEVAEAVQAFLQRVARAPGVASEPNSTERKLRSEARAEAAALGVERGAEGASVREAGARKGAKERLPVDGPGAKRRREGGKKEKAAPVEPEAAPPAAPQAASEGRVARSSRAAKKPLEKRAAAARRAALKRAEPPSKGRAAKADPEPE